MRTPVCTTPRPPLPSSFANFAARSWTVFADGRARRAPCRWPSFSVVLGLGVSKFVISRLPEARPFVIIAHRAGALLAPENTLAALELAIEAGADYAEIDVQRTRDGVLVIVHDSDLKRVAGVPRRVRRSHYADIAHLVQGRGAPFPDELLRIATLEEFLERSRGRIC
jgi:glycerophosphoryl diester phosphodiesterase